MKKENSTLKKQIKAYSALAGSMLAMINVSDAQIIYTNVDPDVTGTDDGATYSLDLNNDATVDFKILVNSQGQGTVKMSGEALGDNAIAGSYNAGYGYKYPYALDLNDVIDADLYWNGGNGHTMASTGYFAGSYGHWFGETDKYMGLRLDIGGDNHYGWVRLDVSDDAHTFVVKDYAYEATAEAQILAGDGSVGIEPLVNTNIKVFASGKQIFVNFKNVSEGFIVVSDLEGRNLRAYDITSSAMVLPMKNQAAGVYFVTVEQEGKTSNYKIVLQ